jgi:peroxiredoxin
LEALFQKYKGRGVQVLVIDVKESKPTVASWAKRVKYSLPILLDASGKTSSSYAPAGVQPDLERDQVPIASNLIIDKEGRIRFYSLLDSVHFDAKLVALTAQLEELLARK